MALRKVQVMLDFGARVTVVAPKVCEELAELADSYDSKSIERKETQILTKNDIVILRNGSSPKNRELKLFRTGRSKKQ